MRFSIRDEVKFDSDGITETLNRWGLEGWEVVSTETIARQPYGTLYFVVTLKRELLA